MYARDSGRTWDVTTRRTHWRRHQLRTAVERATLRIAFCDDGAVPGGRCVWTVCENTARGTRCRAANLAMVTVVGIRFGRGGTIPATVFSANSALPAL